MSIEICQTLIVPGGLGSYKKRAVKRYMVITINQQENHD